MEKEREREQAYLARVEAYIEESLNGLYEKKEGLKQEVLAARRDMWEESSHLIRDFDDVVQLAVEEGQVSAAERRYRQNERELARLSKQRFSPYFGRLDYVYLGREHTIYIGVYSLRQEDSREMLAVDWRAPAASMFYSFDLGPGWYEPPGGRREVTITRKRQLKIEDGRLRMMYDADSAMYDGILGGVLSQNTDHNLRVIISSIQREQNAAIRCNTRRSCLIYGLAGSGKTSVGLHRLAYILYHNRDRLKAEQLLILSNNAIFQSYISTILPDLGEQPAESTVFHRLLQEAVGEEYAVEDYYGYLGAVEAAPDSRRRAWMGVKYSLDFLDSCAAWFSSFAYKIPELRYRDSLVLSQELFDKRWKRTNFSSFQASYALAEQIAREAVEDFFRTNEEQIKRDIEEESQEFLSKKEIAFLCRRTRQQYTAAALEGIVRLNRLDPKAQAVQLLGDYMEKTGGDSQAALALSRALQGRELWYEDGLFYLFIQILMGAVAARPSVQHIVIDEAQDYNPLQLRIIRHLYPKSRYTILADGFQALDPRTGVPGRRQIQRALEEDFMEIRLEKCYRSSSEINALAFRLLEGEYPQLAQEYSYFERHTQRPRYVVSAEPLAALGPILDRLGEYGSIAVITSGADQARLVKAHLGDEAQLITEPEGRLEGRLTVLPLILAKGLEFDAVILFRFMEEPGENPRRRLYLGCTRALHALYLLERQALPPQLEDCLPYLDMVQPEKTPFGP